MYIFTRQRDRVPMNKLRSLESLGFLSNAIFK